MVFQFSLHIRYLLEVFRRQFEFLLVNLGLMNLIVQMLYRFIEHLDLVWEVVHMNDLFLEEHGLLFILIDDFHFAIQLMP